MLQQQKKQRSWLAAPGEVSKLSAGDRGQGASEGSVGHRREGKAVLGRGQSLLQTQVVGKQGGWQGRVIILCTSWPDLKHTFIQQIFIKRLFVQGTSGEGGLKPGPRPPTPPPAAGLVTPPKRLLWGGARGPCRSGTGRMARTPTPLRATRLHCSRALSPASPLPV